LHGEFRHALQALVTDPLHAQNKNRAHFVAAWLPVEALWEVRKGLHTVNSLFQNKTSTYLAISVTDNGFGSELDLSGGVENDLPNGYTSKSLRELCGDREWVVGYWNTTYKKFTVQSPAQQVQQLEVSTREHAVTELVNGRFALCDGILHSQQADREIHRDGASSYVQHKDRLGQILALLKECREDTEIRSEFRCGHLGGTISDVDRLIEYLTRLDLYSAGEVTNHYSSPDSENCDLWVTLSELLQVPFPLSILPHQTEV
jgi:hypothetical protein